VSGRLRRVADDELAELLKSGHTSTSIPLNHPVQLSRRQRMLQLLDDAQRFFMWILSQEEIIAGKPVVFQRKHDPLSLSLRNSQARMRPDDWSLESAQAQAQAQEVGGVALDIPAELAETHESTARDVLGDELDAELEAQGALQADEAEEAEEATANSAVRHPTKSWHLRRKGKACLNGLALRLKPGY
jgi:hypothetical protein